MTRKYVFLVLLGVLMSGVYGIRFMQPAQSEDPRELLKLMPSNEAYEKFKEMNRTASLELAHTNAHLFGEALYEKEGVKGFAVCDSSFGFGCYHSFIARAVADEGEKVVPLFDEECVRMFGLEGLGCSHGVGHGVLSYYGYNPEDVQKALEICATLSWKNAYGGCRDGVFMEYNFRVMETNRDDRLRAFTEAERHEPCTSLQHTHQQACYFSQPGWWLHVFTYNSESIHRIAGYCDEVTDTNGRRACFRGLGYTLAAYIQFDVTAGVRACDSLEARREGKVACHQGLAWALYANPPYRELAKKACTEGLSSLESKQCEAEYLFVLQ